MSTTFALRKKLIDIARRDVGKVETSRNQAPWIKKLWTATTYPTGYEERQPYCAAGVCYCIREWLKDKDVLKAFGFTELQAERWRVKYASVYLAPGGNNVLDWAKTRNLQILNKNDNFHAGDLIIYTYSHVEFYIDDAANKKIICIGYNTDSGGSRDGDGCFEKERTRKSIKCAIRLLE